MITIIIIGIDVIFIFIDENWGFHILLLVNSLMISVV